MKLHIPTAQITNYPVCSIFASLVLFLSFIFFSSLNCRKENPRPHVISALHFIVKAQEHFLT